MIELFCWNTADSHSVAAMLEACRLRYQVYPVDSENRAEQPIRFEAISPNTVPAIIDPQGPEDEEISIFGTSAILIYLADRTQNFRPDNPAEYYHCVQWLCWQQTDLSPVLCEAMAFQPKTPDLPMPDALNHRVRQRWQALANQLSGREFICGEDMTIADFALYPWVATTLHTALDPSAIAPIGSWLSRMAAVESLQRGMQVP